MPAENTTSKQSFLNNFELLSKAGVGVMITHAKEPHRVTDVLRHWALSKDRSFHEWNCRDGWTQHSANPEDALSCDNCTDLMLALSAINDVPGQGAAPIGSKTTTGTPSGIFVMHYPHWFLPNTPAAIQCLKIYAREFAETKQRLVLVVPEGYIVPPELQNDIALLDLELPSHHELLSIYKSIIVERGGTPEGSRRRKNTAMTIGGPYTDDEVAKILALGGGMTELEFETALSKAYITHCKAWPNVPLDEFCKIIHDTKVEVVKRSEVLSLIPVGSPDEIGGQDILKEWLADTVASFSPEAREFGADVPKGMVLLGPPGTGKTVGARATGGIFGLPLVKMDLGASKGGIVGESEAKLRNAMRVLKAMAPAVVFIDEIDKAGLSPEKMGNDAGVSDGILQTLLTEMSDNQCGLFWILAGNRVASIPTELLRKGRFDEVFAVLPPNKKERMEILRIHLLKRKQNPDEIKGLDKVVAESEGYVGAEIEAAVKEAVKKAFTRNIVVSGELILSEINTMVPMSVAFREDFETMKTWAANNARYASMPDDSAMQAKVKRTTHTAGRRRLSEEA
jgi:AAA+ superfamily predicted ATPase